MSDSDNELLRRAADGDTAALAELLRRHGTAIRGQLRIDPRWQSVLDPDDVMQVTYLEAFLHIRQLKSSGGMEMFFGWLRRIAENNLRDAVKELTRQKRPQPGQRVGTPAGDESCVALYELLGATSTTPSRHLARSEIQRAITAAIPRLPPDYATVVRLYDLEGRSIEEVAASTGRSQAATHMLRARAHDRLRELLGGESQFLSRKG